MKHLRLFKTEAEYNSAALELPNVSLVEENKVVFYIPKSEEPAVAPIGASIYGLDGKFYSVSEWTTAGKSNSDAVGVAVSNGEHSFVIHPTAEQADLAWSSNYIVEISSVFTTTDRAAAELDFAGEANTIAILAAVQTGTIEDAPAAQYAAGIMFVNGKKGYLPSAGELTLAYTVLDDINSCMTAIGGTALSMTNKSYWSSTQYSACPVWIWNNFGKYVGSFNKYTTCTVRVVSAL